MPSEERSKKGKPTPPKWVWDEMYDWFVAKVGDVELTYAPSEDGANPFILVTKGNQFQMQLDVWKARKKGGRQ